MAGSIEWLAPLRAVAGKRFAAGNGAWKLDPESWKYTRISEFLAEAAPLDTRLIVKSPDLDGSSRTDCAQTSFADLDSEAQATLKPMLGDLDHPLADLNLSSLGQGIFIRTEPGESKTAQVGFESSDAGPDCRRLVVHLAANSQLQLVEGNAAPASLHNLVIQLTLDAGASLSHYRLSGGHGRSWTLIDARVGKGAHYKLGGILVGPQRERIECRLQLLGEEASLETRHLLLGQDTEHKDLQLMIRHAAAKSQSRHLIKALAADKSRLTVRGRIHIEPDCPGTDAALNIRNLMLGGASRIYAKPELEIYTDDVACSHGTTFAELDAEQLFYLLSRGIPRRNARELLLRAFGADCLFKEDGYQALNAHALNRIEALAA